MAVQTTNNKPINPRGNDQSPKGYNRAALYSGKALDFDGVNDEITISNSDSINITGNALTIAGYINTDGSTAWQGICYKDSGNQKGFQLFVDKTGDPNIAFGIHTGGFYRLFSNEVIENNKWYFVVVTYDGVNQSIYINGVFDNSQAATGNITDSSTENLYIGRNTLGSERFNGEIAGFKIFNTALTAAQVSDLYNNPEKIVPTGVEDTDLKLFLPMMEGAGTTAYDGSGNGNHGTISGATYVNGVGSPVAQSAVIDWNKGSNIVVYSEKLDEWGEQNLTATQSTATAPDGSTNAYDLNDSDSGNYGILVPVASVAMAGDYVGSLFVKKTTGALSHYPGFDIGQPGAYVIIDTTNGTTATSGTGGVYSDISVTSYNDDWWRVSAKATINATKPPMRIWPAISQNGTSLSVSATGINTFWGAQVEQADAIGPYVYTGATAQTSPVLLPQGLTSGRDITGVNLFENVRKQGALNLDGNSWAEVHDNASVDVSEFTLEGWIYTNSITSDNRILSKWFSGYPNRTFQFSATNDDLYLYISDGSSSNNTFVLNVLSLNNWYHCVATYDGANLKIYLDGVLQSTTASTMTLKDSTEPVYIGAYVGSLDPSDNTTAQPRIYNRALTAEEIQRNFDAGKNTYKN